MYKTWRMAMIDFFGALIAKIILIFLLAWPLHMLWNGTMVELMLNLQPATYWQAVGMTTFIYVVTIINSLDNIKSKVEKSTEK